MKRRGGAVFLVGLAVVLFSADAVRPTPARAQETRAEEIAARQREKAEKLAPYEPTRFERVMTRLEESFASPPSGFYPTLGSVYPGGGFTPGIGYRRFYQRTAVWDVVGLYSIENYKQIEVGTRTPWHGRGRWVLGTRAGWLDAPAIGYYGQGMDQSQPRTNFRLSQTYGAVTAAMRPNGWTRLHGEVAYEDYQTGGGQGRHASIESIHTPATAPGLYADPTYIRAEATAAIDWRTSPEYSRKGGSYGVTLASFADRGGTYSFDRLDGEVIQHVPVLRETWVISLRGRVQTTLDDDDVVPYFLQPRLGSGRTLRGYSSGRFRDRHSLLTSAEFRWVPSRLALDMAVFFDAGKVTSRREDLDFEDLRSDWGVGARFHGPTATVLRLEAARGSDGWRLVVATNAAF
ncbi:MAG TPA: BamA/TamA family outer membrane protein [Vicinamibacterales bacterium]|nr:BamA/TamA family outer membrane protein [Vicinamibacterales bacterium]